VARALIIVMKKGDVSLPALTSAQHNARRLPHAIAGFSQWVAPQYEDLKESLPKAFEAYREAAVLDGAHLRVPATVASLFVGFDMAVRYAFECGALAKPEADVLRDEGWSALLEAGRAQRRAIEEEKPVLRFLRLLAALITQGAGVLGAKDDVPPVVRGESFLGWYDSERFYLLPEATFAAVERFCRDPFPIRELALRRELSEHQLSECDPERTTKTVRFGEASRRVLVLLRRRMAHALGEEMPIVAAVTDVAGYRD